MKYSLACFISCTITFDFDINFTGCLMRNAMEDINLACGLDSWEMVGQ